VALLFAAGWEVEASGQVTLHVLAKATQVFTTYLISSRDFFSTKVSSGEFNLPSISTSEMRKVSTGVFYITHRSSEL
jgi:hypothetical protein